MGLEPQVLIGLLLILDGRSVLILAWRGMCNMKSSGEEREAGEDE